MAEWLIHLAAVLEVMGSHPSFGDIMGFINHYLTILLRLDLSQALNGLLTNLTFLTFYCIIILYHRFKEAF